MVNSQTLSRISKVKIVKKKPKQQKERNLCAIFS